jgi:hypothetical protein
MSGIGSALCSLRCGNRQGTLFLALHNSKLKREPAMAWQSDADTTLLKVLTLRTMLARLWMVLTLRNAGWMPASPKRSAWSLATRRILWLSRASKLPLAFLLPIIQLATLSLLMLLASHFLADSSPATYPPAEHRCQG